MGVYLGAVAVFERGHYAAAVGIVLRICRRHHKHVQGQPHLVALDLHVPLFHQVEQPHLDPFGQVRQFIDTEDSAIGPGHQAIVDHQFIGQIMALGDLDGVYLANQVCYGDIGRRQLFRVAFLS